MTTRSLELIAFGMKHTDWQRDQIEYTNDLLTLWDRGKEHPCSLCGREIQTRDRADVQYVNGQQELVHLRRCPKRS